MMKINQSINPIEVGYPIYLDWLFIIIITEGLNVVFTINSLILSSTVIFVITTRSIVQVLWK